MNLRKTANHPLLVIELDEIPELLDSINHFIYKSPVQIRDQYDDHKLGVIAR